MAVAEEVVQDTWIGVLRGMDGFEGRSSVRTWLFRILINRARTAGARERRTIAVATPSRWTTSGPPWQRPGSTAAAAGFRRRSGGSRDARTASTAGKMADFLRTAIEDLPDRQRQVVTLRDIEGMSGEEVCGVLEISDGNQRVLLHRGRSRLRQVVETEFGRPS